MTTGLPLTFRVHFGSGGSVDVPAANPAAARAEAVRRRPGEIVSKIKVVKKDPRP